VLLTKLIRKNTLSSCLIVVNRYSYALSSDMHNESSCSVAAEGFVPKGKADLGLDGWSYTSTNKYSVSVEIIKERNNFNRFMLLQTCQ
jgi:hypothetical protein